MAMVAGDCLKMRYGLSLLMVNVGRVQSDAGTTVKIKACTMICQCDLVISGKIVRRILLVIVTCSVLAGAGVPPGAPVGTPSWGSEPKRFRTVLWGNPGTLSDSHLLGRWRVVVLKVASVLLDSETAYVRL